MTPSLAWASDGPTALAFRMATYTKDPRYIVSYVEREFGKGRAPSVEQIETFLARQERISQPRTSYTERQLDAIDARKAARAEAEEQRAREESQRNADRLALRMTDAQAALTALGGHTSQSQRIIAAVAYAFTLTPSIITGKTRKRRHVLARKVAVRLLRDRQIATGKLSLPAIGRMLEGRDHSTICHALATFDAEMDREPWAREIYERLKGAPADA